MKKLVMVALAAVLVFGLTACGEDGNADGLDNLFVNSGKSKLKVNSDDNDLLLYNGAPDTTRPFAGVKAGAQGWGVSNAPTGLWVLVVVSRAEYNRNPADPKVAMSILVYVDNEAATYDIGAGNVGNCQVYLTNTSDSYVEIRENSFEGNVLMTVRPNYHGKQYFMEGNKFLYPIAKVEKKAGNQVVGVFSKTLKDLISWVYFDPSETLSINVTPNDLPDKSVECLIYIYNNLGQGAHVYGGSPGAVSTVINSTLGRDLVNNGNQTPFIISRVAQLNENGEPLNPSFNVSIYLTGPSKTSQVFARQCEIGKAYTVTFNADLSYTEANSGAGTDLEAN